MRLVHNHYTSRTFFPDKSCRGKPASGSSSQLDCGCLIFDCLQVHCHDIVGVDQHCNLHTHSIVHGDKGRWKCWWRRLGTGDWGGTRKASVCVQCEVRKRVCGWSEGGTVLQPQLEPRWLWSLSRSLSWGSKDRLTKAEANGGAEGKEEVEYCDCANHSKHRGMKGKNSYKGKQKERTKGFATTVTRSRSRRQNTGRWFVSLGTEKVSSALYL